MLLHDGFQIVDMQCRHVRSLLLMFCLDHMMFLTIAGHLQPFPTRALILLNKCELARMNLSVFCSVSACLLCPLMMSLLLLTRLQARGGWG